MLWILLNPHKGTLRRHYSHFIAGNSWHIEVLQPVLGYSSGLRLHSCISMFSITQETQCSATLLLIWKLTHILNMGRYIEHNPLPAAFSSLTACPLCSFTPAMTFDSWFIQTCSCLRASILAVFSVSYPFLTSECKPSISPTYSTLAKNFPVSLPGTNFRVYSKTDRHTHISQYISTHPPHHTN